MNVHIEKKEPFIHLFQNSSGYYVYDVNTDKILDIPEEVFNFLYEGPPIKDNFVADYICMLKENGYLHENRVKVSEHPASEILGALLQNKLSHMTLQITQNCNLRCEYCTYSGSYYNREHSNKWMTIDMAKKAIDYYIRHSRDSKRIALSFYGGEPLLAFDTIKTCVLYIEKQAEGRIVDFNFTTNGTLLTEEKIAFLSEHNFNILISLDGPEYIHDKQRKYVNGEGTFHTIIKNVDTIRNKFPDFYKYNISFNTVLDPMNQFSSISEFVFNSERFDEIRFTSTTINDNNSKVDISYSNNFVEDFQYDVFKLFLFKLGWLDKKDVSSLISNYFFTIRRMASRLEWNFQEQIPSKHHRGGPCLPGVQRLFVTVDGDFYPCERVSESSRVAQIGDIDKGIDVEKAKELLNLEQITSEQCKNCWAYYYCTVCISKADDGIRISNEKVKNLCESVQKDIENEFLNYCVLKQLGYKRELDL